MAELQDCIEDINNGVTQSSASDATLEGYTLMLVNGNGELVDKQPVSRIEQLIYNYLTTTRGSALAGVIKNLLPSLLSDQGTSGTKFPSLNSSNVLGSMTAANLASVLGVTFNYYDSSNVFAGLVGYGVMSILFKSQNRKAEIGFLIAGNLTTLRMAVRTADGVTDIQDVSWTELNI